MRKGQPKSFAAGIDVIYADVLDSARKTLGPIPHHTHALVFLVEYTRDPTLSEPGTDWFMDSQAQRAGLLAANTAILLSSYIRLLGYEARAHTVTSSDVDLNKLAVASGLAHLTADGDAIENPYVGRRFGLAAVTTTLALAPDLPLAAQSFADRLRSHGPSWWLGKSTAKNAFNNVPYSRRPFHLGAYPFEKLNRRDETTTFIDEPRVPRFPKRADFFARAVFGDMGKEMQNNAKGGFYVQKSAIGACARRALGALLAAAIRRSTRSRSRRRSSDPARNAANVKAASYYMATDAVGLSRCPEWAYYSHDAAGNVMKPYHKNAVSMLYDQGHETFEGASGDDWISVAQSMRAYLRFSLLGGVIAEQIRRLGYSARVHTVLDGDVLQPPLLLLSGLGEVSRIGEVILNPYLGPRLKSGIVTTDLPFSYDKPLDLVCRPSAITATNARANVRPVRSPPDRS